MIQDIYKELYKDSKFMFCMSNLPKMLKTRKQERQWKKN